MCSAGGCASSISLYLYSHSIRSKIVSEGTLIRPKVVILRWNNTYDKECHNIQYRQYSIHTKKVLSGRLV